MCVSINYELLDSNVDINPRVQLLRQIGHLLARLCTVTMCHGPPSARTRDEELELNSDRSR